MEKPTRESRNQRTSIRTMAKYKENPGEILYQLRKNVVKHKSK